MRLLAAPMAAVVMAAMVMLPEHVSAAVTVEVCVPALADNDAICGTPVPQGAPWVVYRVHGLVPGERITIVADCRWTGATGRADRTYSCHLIGLTANSFTPGEHTVVVQDTATGTELARATYTVTPQTPEQALAAFRAGHSTWARAAAALALARMGQFNEALAAATAMRRDTAPMDQYEGLVLGVNVLLAAGHAVEAEQWAQDVLAWKRARAEDATVWDYVLFARASLAACDIAAAEHALGQASLRAPDAPEVVRLLTRAEEAKTGRCVRPGATVNSENP